MRVLLIDDDPDIRKIGALALASIGGFEVEFAGSGPEGVATAAVGTPDVVLLDRMMPGMDGVETLNALAWHIAAITSDCSAPLRICLNMVFNPSRIRVSATLATQLRALLAAAAGSRRV